MSQDTGERIARMTITATAQRSVFGPFSRQTSLVVAFLLILANSAFALLMFREVHQADDLVVHSQEVVTTLQDVRELIRQAGSSQRGFLLTGDRQFLATYQEAERDLPPLLAKLRLLESG